MYIHNTKEPKQATEYNIGHSRTCSQLLDQVFGEVFPIQFHVSGVRPDMLRFPNLSMNVYT